MRKEEGKPVYVGGRSFRLHTTEEQKKWLFAKAETEGVTVSSIMRSIIDDAMNKSKTK